MKSNEERVKNIMNKAKVYKDKRGRILSSATLTICAIIAVFTHTTMNNKFNVNDFENNFNIVYSGEESVEEKGVLTFASKDELIEKIKEHQKKYEDNNRFFVTNDMKQDAMESITAAPDSAVQEGSTTSSNKEFSTTNTQVQGVDEADIVKTDGNKIYYLHDSKVEVLNVTDEDLSSEKVLSFEEGVYPFEMYLDEKYLVVLANSYINIKDVSNAENSKIALPYYYMPNKSSTKIIVYDINSLEVVREVEAEGNSISSRKVGDDIYVITNKYISFYRDINEDDILPLYKDTCVSGEFMELEATKVKYFSDFDGEDCNYMIITSLNLDNMEEEANINTYLGAGNEVYCSTENLYVAKVQYNRNVSSGRLMIDSISIGDDSSETSIHKFAISNGDVKHIATGKVPGRLLNQFSMDEYDGNFRITTTLNDSGNNLYVLDANMEIIGKLENLAKGEKIYATRFMGDMAYVVTYKTVDPLFVIDLKKPREPKVLGELKIPGYSSYLHPLGDNYLLGFGEDSVEKSYINWEGKTEVVAYANGLKMAIFDVSDYNNPKELHSIKIGARGSYSELLYNHKSILLNEKEGIIAFPASVTEDAGAYDDGTPRYGDVIFEGALVYNLSVEDGISLRGKISHDVDEYKYKNNIQRIIYIGDNLYTFSNSMAKVSDIKTIEEIDSLKF